MMRLRPFLFAAFPSLVLLGSVYAFHMPDGQHSKPTSSKQSYPKPFRVYPGVEYTNFPIPPDSAEKTEWVFARLIYPAVVSYPRWTMDYPRSDRHLAQALRRLTRIHVRSVEQPVSLDDEDDVYNWPWLYGVEVGYWNLTDEQCRKMRDYLLRGGFFMCDDFHGTREWEIFTASMKRVFPDREIREIPNDDPIFHLIYDLDGRYQVPGAQFIGTGRTYEHDGFEPHWRCIRDDKGRIIVAMCHDMDLGDSWEHADNPKYPEKYSALGFRIAANYVAYSMTH